VYRVLDLPASMRPLVYDYGKLSVEAEKSYIEQVVSDHVRSRKHFSLDIVSLYSTLF